MRYLYIIAMCLAPWIVGTTALFWYYHGVAYTLDGVLLGSIAGVFSLGPTVTLFEPLFDWLTKDETMEHTS